MGKRPDIVEDIVIKGPIKVYVAEPDITYAENSLSPQIFYSYPPDIPDISIVECYLIPIREIK